MFDNAIHLKTNDLEIKDGHVFVKHHTFKDKNGFLMIYSPLCSHCQSKEKNIDDMVTYMCISSPDYKVAVLDGDEADTKEIIQALGLQKFPTCVLFYLFEVINC